MSGSYDLSTFKVEGTRAARLKWRALSDMFTNLAIDQEEISTNMRSATR